MARIVFDTNDLFQELFFSEISFSRLILFRIIPFQGFSFSGFILWFFPFPVIIFFKNLFFSEDENSEIYINIKKSTNNHNILNLQNFRIILSMKVKTKIKFSKVRKFMRIQKIQKLPNPCLNQKEKQFIKFRKFRKFRKCRKSGNSENSKSVFKVKGKQF